MEELRDKNISTSQGFRWLDKHNIKCSCGCSTWRLFGDDEKAWPAFIHISRDGFREETKRAYGPFAMFTCERCGEVRLFEIERILEG